MNKDIEKKIIEILNSTKGQYYYCSSCKQSLKKEELIDANHCKKCGSVVYDLREWIH